MRGHSAVRGRVLRPVEDYAPVPLPTLSLVEALAEARAWQAEAEQVIELCVAPGGKTRGLARRVALVTTVYGRLCGVVRALPASPAQHEAVLLLTFHHRLLHEALKFGFLPDSPARERVARHFRGGLGGPGPRLVALYEQVRVAVVDGAGPTVRDGTDPSAPEGDDPPGSTPTLDLGPLN